jgi:hypothetical protein
MRWHQMPVEAVLLALAVAVSAVVLVAVEIEKWTKRSRG